MTKRDVAWRTEALRECWEQQMTPKECAAYIGVTRAQVYAIFAGREWKGIPRPEGFMYPFPSASPRRRSDAVWRAEALDAYVRERMTTRQFAEHIGFSIGGASYILRGYGWKETPRPKGFLYPWPKDNFVCSRVA